MRYHISIPFELLREKYLPKVLEKRIGVEITLKAEALDNFSRGEFRKIAHILKEEEIPRSIHLPFMDLSLAALDPWIRKVSLNRLIQGLERASLFEPIIAVFHSGYHPDYHREPKEEWRKIFIEESLQVILKEAKDLKLTLALENVFEPDPTFLEPIFMFYKGDLFWCFDPAHAKVFSEKEELEWLKLLGFYLQEIHCHDNLGKWDDHLPLGKGIIKFEEIFAMLRAMELQPLFTIEAKKEEDALLSLHYLQAKIV
ncbi:MAG: sugar phosphate isomerase/epimerase family protein [Caldimicrobium sp.]